MVVAKRTLVLHIIILIVDLLLIGLGIFMLRAAYDDDAIAFAITCLSLASVSIVVSLSCMIRPKNYIIVKDKYLYISTKAIIKEVLQYKLPIENGHYIINIFDIKNIKVNSNINQGNLLGFLFGLSGILFASRYNNLVLHLSTGYISIYNLKEPYKAYRLLKEYIKENNPEFTTYTFGHKTQ